MPKPTEVQVHPTAIVESDHIGAGTRIWAFAHVMPGARIGRDCNICDQAYIEGGACIGDGVVVKNRALIYDGVTIEDGAFIGPAVVFTNDKSPRSRHLDEAQERYAATENWLEATRVGHGAAIGAGAIIVCGITIGHHATIGAGAVLTRHAEPHGLYVGNPAVRIGYVCRCGRRLSAAMVCTECGRQYEVDETGQVQEDAQSTSGVPGTTARQRGTVSVHAR